MITERYIVNFYSVREKQFSIAEVKSLWLAASINESERYGVFVNGVIESMELICDIREMCNMDGAGVRIIATRNPALHEDREVYFNAMRHVILDVKRKLGNPYVTISILNTNFFYFDSV